MQFELKIYWKKWKLTVVQPQFRVAAPGQISIISFLNFPRIKRSTVSLSFSLQVLQ